MSVYILTEYNLRRRTYSGTFIDYFFDSKKTLDDMVEWANREFDIQDQTFSKDGRCCILTAYPKSDISQVGIVNSRSLQEAVRMKTAIERMEELGITDPEEYYEACESGLIPYDCDDTEEAI